MGSSDTSGQKDNMLKRLLRANNNRNRVLITNILFSGLLKSTSLLVSLLLVPLTLGYLNAVRYGVWMVISSVLFWIATFDIGLGNGMRNYLSAAISRKDWVAARAYLSTTLILLTGIALLMGLVSTILIMNMDTCAFFNTHAVSESELRTALLSTVLITLVYFVVKNIGVVFISLQKYALSDLLSVGSSVLSLLAIFILTRLGDGSLLPVVIINTSFPVIIFLLAAIPIFYVYPHLRPHFKDFKKAIGKELVSKGLGFFFIQITSCLIIYGCANYFITQYCGPEKVTVFNIAYKYFNLLVIGYTIIISPMWSAYTDAVVKGDYLWIDKTFKRALAFWGLSVLGGFVLLWGSPYFYHFWIKDKVNVPLGVSLSVLFYVSMFNLNNCVTYLLNGLNKIRMQIYISVGGTAVYVLLIHIVQGSRGIEGITYIMGGVYGLMALVFLYQCRLLIRQRARGVWDK